MALVKIQRTFFFFIGVVYREEENFTSKLVRTLRVLNKSWVGGLGGQSEL
jgi:hypothetical protein